MRIPPAPPPPQGVGPGSHATPGHNPVHLASVRPPHVFTPPSGGALLPSVQWCGHVAPQHPIACRGSALRANIWVSPDTFLPHTHATHLPHPPRTPPCRPPALVAQPCLHHGHRPYPCQSPGAGGCVPAPTPPEVGPGLAPSPPRARCLQATPTTYCLPQMLPRSRTTLSPALTSHPERANVPEAQTPGPGRAATRISTPLDSTCPRVRESGPHHPGPGEGCRRVCHPAVLSP